MTWTLRIAALLVPSAIACGCGQGGRAPHANPDASGGSNPSSTGGSAAGGEDAWVAGGAATGGADSPAGGLDDGPAELGGASNDEVQVVEVPSGEDVTLPVAPEVFLETTEQFYVFDRAGALSERRFAFDSSSLALITFGADGGARSDLVLDLPVAAAARGDDLVVLQLDDDDQLVAITYDKQLQRLADELPLTTTSAGAYALAGSADRSVAVWNDGSELHGRLFDADGVTGDGFDFGPHSCGSHDCAASVVHTGNRFAVLWSRVDANGESLLSWGTIDDQGAALAARNVVSSATPIRLEDVTSLPGGRLAVLLSSGSPARNPLLLFVDAYGALSGPVHLYAGASAAWTMASDGDSLLIAARSNRSQGVIRQLDLTGEPLGDWLVIDDSGVSTAFEPRVALFSVDQRYGAVVRLTDGSSATLSLDPETFPEP
jgi:hypothetical protein